MASLPLGGGGEGDSSFTLLLRLALLVSIWRSRASGCRVRCVNTQCVRNEGSAIFVLNLDIKPANNTRDIAGRGGGWSSAGRGITSTCVRALQLPRGVRGQGQTCLQAHSPRLRSSVLILIGRTCTRIGDCVMQHQPISSKLVESSQTFVLCFGCKASDRLARKPDSGNDLNSRTSSGP